MVNDRLPNLILDNARLYSTDDAHKHDPLTFGYFVQISGGKSKKWIARNDGHELYLIHNVRAALAADPSQIYVLHHVLGSPTKLRSRILDRINTLTASNREMSSAAIAEIVPATPSRLD
jgi:hypothetical protein